MRRTLDEACEMAALVSIERASFDATRELGYVVGVGARFFLLLLVSDEIRFNGFSALRVDDLSEIQAPHPHADFVEEALRLRGEEIAEAPAVALDDPETLLRTAGRAFELLAIHREEVDPESCHIGKVVSVSADELRLLEIDADAEWEEEPATFPLADITRVDFGGGYEEALGLVGGPPPRVRHLRPVE